MTLYSRVKVKLIDLIESRSADLYHLMGYDKALWVLEHDMLEAHWTHDIPNLGKKKGISFSRNKFFHYGEKAVKLTIDQQKLSAFKKIIPLDAELVYRHNSGLRQSPDLRDRKMNKKSGQQYAEEFVVGEIKQLHRVLKKVDVNYAVYHRQSMFKQLMKDVREYCKKYNIELFIDARMIKHEEQIKKEEQYDESFDQVQAA